MTSETAQEQEVEADTAWVTTASGLKYIDHVVGQGEVAATGMTVEMHYTGWLWENEAKGEQFDSSVGRAPFQFPLGAGRVIKGWDEGFALLSKGAKAILKIPPELGYGSRDLGTIPANSTLIFEVELLDIIKPVPIIPYDTENKVIVTTDSGLKFILIEEGNGKNTASRGPLSPPGASPRKENTPGLVAHV